MKAAPTTTAELNFSGTRFYVEVKLTCWEDAQKTLGRDKSATKQRECCVVAKLMEATGSGFAAKFKTPTDHGHDVIIVLHGKNHTVDIKCLFPDVGLTRDNTDEVLIVESLTYEIDTSVNKERGQGNICCFDLSFVGDARRQALVSYVNEKYPECITLEYDRNGGELHVIWPALKIKVTKGRWTH